MDTVRIAEQAPDGFIADQTYEECVIQGPAVLQLGNPQVHFEVCEYDEAKDMVFAPVEQPLHGAIDLMNVTFRRCTFRHVGIVGPQALIDKFFV